MLVELCGAFIDNFHNYRCGRYLNRLRQGAM